MNFVYCRLVLFIIVILSVDKFGECNLTAAIFNLRLLVNLTQLCFLNIILQLSN